MAYAIATYTAPDGAKWEVVYDDVALRNIVAHTILDQLGQEVVGRLTDTTVVIDPASSSASVVGLLRGVVQSVRDGIIDTTGLTASRVNSAATTNATNIKSSAAKLRSLSLFNTSAATKYFKLYNKASSPTVGTDTPVWTIPLPAGGGFSREFVVPVPFATGLSYAITGSQADTDTTAVAAGDVTGQMLWL